MESETDRVVLSHSFKFVVHDLQTCTSTRGNQNTQASRTRSGGATTSTTTSLYDFTQGDFKQTKNVATVSSYAGQKQALAAFLECHLKATAPSQNPSYASCATATTALIPAGRGSNYIANGIDRLAKR